LKKTIRNKILANQFVSRRRKNGTKLQTSTECLSKHPNDDFQKLPPCNNWTSVRYSADTWTASHSVVEKGAPVRCHRKVAQGIKQDGLGGGQKWEKGEKTTNRMALMFDGLDSRKHHQLIIKHQPFHQNNKPSNITNCHSIGFSLNLWPFKGGRFRGHDIPAALHCNTLQGTRFVRCGPDDLGDDLTVIEGFHIMDMEGMTNKYFELCNGMGVLAEKRVFGMVWMLIIVTILGHTKNRKDVFTPKISWAWFVGVHGLCPKNA